MEQGTSNALLSPPELSPLEQDVLDEYERLAENMKKVCSFPTRPQSFEGSPPEPLTFPVCLVF
jgi:hypothetical protein